MSTRTTGATAHGRVQQQHTLCRHLTGKIEATQDVILGRVDPLVRIGRIRAVCRAWRLQLLQLPQPLWSVCRIGVLTAVSDRTVIKRTVVKRLQLYQICQPLKGTYKARRPAQQYLARVRARARARERERESGEKKVAPAPGLAGAAPEPPPLGATTMYGCGGR
jgi:hypothetical protein